MMTHIPIPTTTPATTPPTVEEDSSPAIGVLVVDGITVTTVVVDMSPVCVTLNGKLVPLDSISIVVVEPMVDISSVCVLVDGNTLVEEIVDMSLDCVLLANDVTIAVEDLLLVCVLVDDITVDTVVDIFVTPIAQKIIFKMKQLAN